MSQTKGEQALKDEHVEKEEHTLSFDFFSGKTIY